MPLRQTGSSGEARLTPLVQTSDAARSEPLPPDTGKADTGLQTIAVLSTKKLGAASPGASGATRVAGSDERRAELVLVGDVDFATNSFFHVLGNGALFLNAVSYLADQQRLIDITPRQYELPRVQLSNGQMRATFVLSTVVLPLAALLMSVWVAWRRRR